MKHINEYNSSTITEDIPVIDNDKILPEIRKLLREFFEDHDNAYHILILADNDNGSILEKITRYFRNSGIDKKHSRVLIDNTW